MSRVPNKAKQTRYRGALIGDCSSSLLVDHHDDHHDFFVPVDADSAQNCGFMEHCSRILFAARIVATVFAYFRRTGATCLSPSPTRCHAYEPASSDVN